MISPRGSDIFFSEESLNAGRTFANKVWNASKLIISNMDDGFTPISFEEIPVRKLRVSDKWILFRLAVADREINEHLRFFRFNDAAIAAHRFIWHEFCDWYLEITKLTVYGQDNDDSKRIVQSILYRILEQALKLLHPFMPFITEEIWSNFHPDNDSIMLQSLADVEVFLELKDDADAMEIVKRTITAIRTIRSETRIPPSHKINAMAGVKSEMLQNLLESSRDEIIYLGRLNEIMISAAPELPEIRATTVTEDGIDIYIDLEGIVDVPTEIDRLKKEIDKTILELKKVSQKLSNKNFIEKAPDDVVEKSRRIHRELTEKQQKLKSALRLFSGYGES